MLAKGCGAERKKRREQPPGACPVRLLSHLPFALSLVEAIFLLAEE